MYAYYILTYRLAGWIAYGWRPLQLLVRQGTLLKYRASMLSIINHSCMGVADNHIIMLIVSETEKSGPLFSSLIV